MKKSKKKVIAIYADSFNGKVGATLPYIGFAKLFGTPRLVTADDDVEELLENCDILLIPGGADVSSFRYKESPHPFNSRANMHYEYMDSEFGEAFIKAGKPIIGICRGFQSLNVILTAEGEHFEVNSMHHQGAKQLGKGLIPTSWAAVYRGCPTTFDREGITVQTFKGEKGKKRELLAIVESFQHEELPIIGFQWHPEEFNCEFAIREINAMLKDHFKEA